MGRWNGWEKRGILRMGKGEEVIVRERWRINGGNKGESQ